MLSRFHLIPERNGQTDGQTDLLYQYRASVCWHAIKTDVSDTIRKPPLAEAKTASGKPKKYGDERFSVWRLRFWPDRSNLHAILNQVPKFRPNRATAGGVMTSYTISRWRPRRLYTISGFIFNVVTFFQSSKSIYIPNFIIDITWIHRWDITTSVWKNKRLPYWNTFSGCEFDHVTVIGMLFCIRLSNFSKSGRP